METRSCDLCYANNHRVFPEEQQAAEEIKEPRRKSMPKKALFADAGEVKPPSPIRNFPSLPSPNFQRQQEEENMTDSNQSMDMEIDSDDVVQPEQNEQQQTKEEMLISFDSPAKNIPKLYPEITDNSKAKRLSFPSIFKSQPGIEVQAEEEDQTMDFTEIPKPQIQDEPEEDEQTMEFTHVPGNGQHEDEEQTMDFTQVQHHNSAMADDDEQTMEMTRPIGGLNKQFEGEEDEEEQTMDFTRPYGGNSWQNEYQEEQTMEMTRAIGSIQQRPSMEEPDEDDQTMEMTQAIGKINQGNEMMADDDDDDDDDDGEQTMEFTRPLSSRTNEEDADDGEQTMEFTRPLQVNNAENTAEDDGEQTMEFTRPLPAKFVQEQQEDSSAESLIPQPKTPPKKSPRKSKSPASAKSGSNKKKSPIKTTTATTVATPPSKTSRKRSSSPRKTTPSPSKKPKLDVPEEPPAAATPIKQVTPSTAITAPGSQRTPSHVLKDQIQSLTPRRSSVRRTPSKSASAKKPSYVLPFEPEKVSYTPLRSVKKPSGSINSTLDVVGNSSPTPSKKKDLSTSLPPIQEPEYQNVSLQDFLNMISIDFMDDFLTSTRGHSSFGVTYEPSEEPNFTDYVVSAQKLPLLELYDFSSREMKNNVKDAKELFSQLEAETLEENPLLFREYIEASADTKQVMSSQFKLIKSYARQQAKSVWYDWRTQLTNGVHEALKKNLKSLQDDQKVVESKRPAVEKAYNDISSKYMEMRNKLERMRKRADELANCDRDEFLAAQERLSTRKRDLASAQKSLEEQTNQVRDYRELVESQLQEKRKLQDSIQAAEKIRLANKRIDLEDIAHLRDKFMTIQKCMDFNQCTLSGSVLEGIVQGTLRVRIDLKANEIATEPISQPTDDSLCLSFLNKQITSHDEKTTPLVERLNNIRKLWHQANRMNSEINLYRLQHIISFSEETLDNEPALVLSTRLFSETPTPSKMFVKIRIKGSSVATYPSQIQGNITLSVVYGEQWGKSMGETCGQLEHSLLSKGLPGVFNKCIGILQGN